MYLNAPPSLMRSLTQAPEPSRPARRRAPRRWTIRRPSRAAVSHDARLAGQPCAAKS